MVLLSPLKRADRMIPKMKTPGLYTRIWLRSWDLRSGERAVSSDHWLGPLNFGFCLSSGERAVSLDQRLGRLNFGFCLSFVRSFLLNWEFDQASLWRASKRARHERSSGWEFEKAISVTRRVTFLQKKLNFGGFWKNLSEYELSTKKSPNDQTQKSEKIWKSLEILTRNQKGSRIKEWKSVSSNLSNVVVSLTYFCLQDTMQETQLVD